MTNKEIGIIVIVVVLVSALVYFVGQPETENGTEPETPTTGSTQTPTQQKPTDNPKPQNPTNNKPGTNVNPAGFAIGQTIQFSGVTLTTTSVIEDSRCPEGGNEFACIWEGTVRVLARLRQDSYTNANIDDIVEFTLGVPKKYGNYEITLTGALPYPQAGETIRDSEYRFTWVVVDTQ